MSALNDTCKTLARLVAYPTVSSEPNFAMISDLASRLSNVGAEVEVFEDESGRKANLWARLGPERAGGVLLSGHTDVVPVEDQAWSSDPFLLREEDGKLFARGSCDMKGFIAAAVTLAERVDPSRLARPIWFGFTHDEEVGCLGARSLSALLKDRPLKPSMALIGEPTEMRIIEGHKGCCEYTTRFTGLEGHGSRPDLGVNAVGFAVRYVARLLALAAKLQQRAPVGSRFQPPWTTVNIGRLHGGVAHNVIPGRAEVDWEMRPVQDADADFVKAALEALVEHELLPEMRAICPDATITTEVIGEVAGLLPMDDCAARDLIASLTGQNDGADLVAFSTEAGLFQALGMSAVVCGPGSIAQAHKPDEYIEVGQLAACLEMLDGVARSLERGCV